MLRNATRGMMAKSNKSVSNQNHVFYKILLIGDSCVGKTSVLYRFLKRTYVNNTHLHDFHLGSVEMDGTRIQLQLWDSPGNERFV